MLTGRLENWTVVSVSSIDFVIYGDMYDDNNNRFKDGTAVRTSSIKQRPVSEGDIVETKNSTYLLGKPRE